MIAPIEENDKSATASILFVGDAGSATIDALRTLGDVTCVGTADAAGSLARNDLDVIVVDEGEDASGRELLAQAVALGTGAARVLLAHAIDGVSDDVAVLPKPVDANALRAVCTLALRCAEARRAARDLESENQRLRGVEIETTTATLEDVRDLERYENVLTRSPVMKRTIAFLRRLENSDTTVLVHGETGTGKGLVAQAIHARSRVRAGRFVAVNLGAIPDHLRESELCGHVRGAFAGATEHRAGLLAEANGGTLFLDEVGVAGPALQVALLRALEQGTVTPVGSDRSRRVNLRIIAGTSRNLEELVRQGLFRRDLYDRLNVFPVQLPPLRDRPEDLVPLARQFLGHASLAMGKKPPEVSREARAVLEAHPWEGNVRELRNAMERAAIVCKAGMVTAADLPMSGGRSSAEGGPAAPAASTIVIPPGGAKLQQLEREIFLKTLALAGDNQSRAARILGLRESTFRFRLQKLGIASRRRTAVPLGRVAMFVGTASITTFAVSILTGC